MLQEVARPMSVRSSSSYSSMTKVSHDSVIKVAAQSRGTNKVTASLAQLHIANMNLHGREDDLQLLKSKLIKLKNNCKKDTPNLHLPELILVSGVSGVGKSALVMKGLKEPSTKMGITFASGKFDLNNAALPLSAFSDAMASLTKIIIEGDARAGIESDIKQAFEKKDMIHIVKALPGCKELFPVDKTTVINRSFPAIACLQYAIRSLLKIICTHLKGVLLFIDDLQWADLATLDLLRSISLDGDIPSFLGVGAYREDEVSESHPLAIHIRELGQMGIKFTTISVGNLSLSNVTSLVAEALRMEDNEDAVKSLAETVHKKTDGNAFFVLLFLRSLYDEELIQYNFGIMSWRWDDQAVKAQLATENVATMLSNKLRRLNQSTQNVLKVASCLGSRISPSAMAVLTDNISTTKLNRLSSSVADTEPETDDDASVLDYSINELETEGIWEKDDNEDVWCFSHDRIQSAAFSLISPEKQDSFRGEIGNILQRNLEPGDLEASLFEVVSLRNCSAISSNEDERRELAKLNLRAGMKASDNAAFDSAAIFYSRMEATWANHWMGYGFTNYA